MIDDKERYRQAQHAMQSGVALEMALGRNAQTSPKHLRVGVNTAMRDHASLAALLISKGFITESEYITAIADGMEKEAESYSRDLGVDLA